MGKRILGLYCPNSVYQNLNNTFSCAIFAAEFLSWRFEEQLQGWTENLTADGKEISVRTPLVQQKISQ